MDDRKIYCEVLEGITYSDRCLFKLSKIIEGNRTCENCILRQFERMKSGKAGRSGVNVINDIKSIKDMKNIEGIKKKNRRVKPRCGRKPGSIAGALPDPGRAYTVQSLSNLLGKSERRVYEFVKEGKIPGHKIGARWHFNREEIDYWFSEKEHHTDVVMISSPQSDQDGQGSSQPEET